jgi:hypothetical protein
MIQRVGIAQALVNQPELVILDEPMSGLDPVGRREVRELILTLRDQGRTVLFSSHNPVRRRVAVHARWHLAKGKLVASGALTELTAAGRRGNEVVASNVTDGLAAPMAPRVSKTTRIGDADTRSTSRPKKRWNPSSRHWRRRRVARVCAAPAHIARGRASWSRCDDRPPHRVVAWHVFKESVRDRVLYGIAGFAVLLVGVSFAIGQSPRARTSRSSRTSAWRPIELAGALIAIFIGIGLVAREIDRKSIFSLLAKPLPRWEFVAGKYLGLVLTVIVNEWAMGAGAVRLAGRASTGISPGQHSACPGKAPALDPRLLLVLVMISIELSLAHSRCVVCSTFSSSALVFRGAHHRHLRGRSPQHGPARTSPIWWR